MEREKWRRRVLCIFAGIMEGMLWVKRFDEMGSFAIGVFGVAELLFFILFLMTYESGCPGLYASVRCIRELNRGTERQHVIARRSSDKNAKL
jgi:hypothetical protein